MNDQSQKNRDDDEFARILQRKHEQLIHQTTKEPATGDIENTADDERVQSAMMVLELLEELKTDRGIHHETQRETVANPSTQENLDRGKPNSIPRSSTDTLVPNLRQLGRFQISEQIGRGGYGIVVRGFDPRLEREVAIKIPRFEAALSAESRTRFVRESKAAASLNHPGIVAIHETGSAEGVDFIVSELVDGENLGTLLARGRKLTSEESAVLVAHLADAIEHAHQRGILHRDLKPSNVLIAGDDFSHPKITDFGLASIVDQQDFTQTGAVVGTPAYMSPEQATGKKDIQPQTDVYGLGTILYQLLTGQPPFDGLPIIDTIRAIVDKDPMTPRTINPAISKDLESVCLKCLEKNPSKRYGSARDLQIDLQRFLDNQPVMARPITQSIRLRRWARRNPAIAISGSAAALFLLTALVASLWGWVSTSTALAGERKARIAARNAVNQYFTEIADNDLLDVPGLTPLRHKLLSNALVYYQDFLSDRDNDPDLLEEIEQSHFRVGKIYLELGQPKDGLNHFNQALQTEEVLLATNSDQPEIVARKMITLRHIGTVQSLFDTKDEAIATIDEAISGLRELHENDANNSAFTNELAEALFAKAIILKESSQLPTAQLLLSEAIELMQFLVLQEPTNNKFLRRLAGGYIDLANTMGQQGEIDKTVEPLDDAIGIFRTLANEDSQSPKDLSGLANALYNRATKHLIKREFDKASPLLEEATGLSSQLALAYPKVIDYRKQQATYSNGAGFCYSNLGLKDEAIGAFITNTAALERIVELDPDVVENKEGLAVAKLNLGSSLGQHRNEFAESIVYLKEAQDLILEVLQKNPDRVNALIGEGLCALTLAGSFNGAKEYETALQQAERSIEILQSLNTKLPNNPQVVFNIPLAKQNRATALEHLGQLDESIKVWREVVELTNGNAKSLNQLKLAAVLAKADQHPEAMELVVANETPGDPKTFAFDLGRTRALIAKSWTRTEEFSEEEINAQCNLAVDSLEQARLDGKLQSPAAHDKLQNSTDFDLLRPRDDFQQILSQVLN